jgi:hypothetical protein
VKRTRTNLPLCTLIKKKENTKTGPNRGLLVEAAGENSQSKHQAKARNLGQPCEICVAGWALVSPAESRLSTPGTPRLPSTPGTPRLNRLSQQSPSAHPATRQVGNRGDDSLVSALVKILGGKPSPPSGGADGIGGGGAEVFDDALTNALVRNLNWWYHGAPRRGAPTGQTHTGTVAKTVLNCYSQTNGLLMTATTPRRTASRPATWR